MILEPFGGPGGWSQGLAMLGRTDAVGVELDRDACRTAVAAGHLRVRADVAAFPLGHLAGRVEGLVMSPPCQAFSRAGKRLGLKDQPGLYAHLKLIARAGRWVDYDPADWHDRRSPLVLQAVRWVDALRPEWVACEQVPDVIPLWSAIARWLHGLGYGTAVGLRSAECFGVPQTRQRAFLVARLGGSPHLPAATHQPYEPGRPARQQEPDLWGPGLLPWVSMADALGWARTVRARADRWQLLPSGREKVNDRTLPRPLDAPAMTVAFGHSDMLWTLRTNQVPAGMDGEYQRRPADEPAPTVSGQGRSWGWERPATAVCGDPRLAGPGHRDREGGQRQFDEQAVRVEVWQAGVLQSFPADYPWQGTRTAQYRQVGDAVPPLLAAAVLGELLGVDWRHRLWGLERAS